MGKMIGRKQEQQIFKELTISKKAEFIAIYGRRRVGKTFLIEHYFSQSDVYMACSGTKDGSVHNQLFNFIEGFQKTFYPNLSLTTPKTWREALLLLTNELKKIPRTKKIALFFDELPWLAKPKSMLLQQLDYYWNMHWSKMPNVIVIVCGSAASWMLEKLINAKGGLHNRITRSILLEPFTLGETKQFLEAINMKLSDKQILDIYMVTGGVPFYLSYIQKSLSVAQNIQNLCFEKDGLLYTEFPRLFSALFKTAELNLRIVREIAKHRYGVAFSQLTKKSGKTAGGRFKKRLDELEAAGFIQKYLPYGKQKRDHYYKVIDEYTLFYLKWIEPIEGRTIPKGSNYWIHLSKSPGAQSWAGYAFEGICHKHIHKIIHRLKLDGVGCIASHWRYIPMEPTKETGAQIDLLLDRTDDAITLFEIKYATHLVVIDKGMAKNLLNKLDLFKKQFPTHKQIFIVYLTTMGVKPNIWSKELIQAEVILGDLF